LLKINIKGFDLEFETSEKCFSPRQIDAGTLAMLSRAEFASGQKVLDLGCGYGVVGITAAKQAGAENVYMTDIDQDAVNYSKINAGINDVDAVNIVQSDGYISLDETGFDIILSNPPYHTDFSVAKAFIEKGFNRLKTGGKFFMVTKRKDWYKNKLTAIFGGAKVYEINDYFVFESEKRSNTYYKKDKF
jgi:16S rRNA (guanine1207-N2)-methyltransferase